MSVSFIALLDSCLCPHHNVMEALADHLAWCPSSSRFQSPSTPSPSGRVTRIIPGPSGPATLHRSWHVPGSFSERSQVPTWTKSCRDLIQVSPTKLAESHKSLKQLSFGCNITDEHLCLQVMFGNGNPECMLESNKYSRMKSEI